MTNYVKDGAYLVFKELGPDGDLMVPAWCENCETHHHFYVRKLRKQYDLYQLALGKPKADGALGFIKRCKDRLAVLDAIEEITTIEDEYEDDEDEEDS